MRLSWPLSAAIGRLGQRRGGDLERADLDLDAAELDALVVLELAVHREERAGGQRRDRCRSARGRRHPARSPSSARARRRVDQLHRAGLIAKDDELHLLLIADGLDPSGDRDRAVDETLQLLDENAFTHERPVYVGGCASRRSGRIGPSDPTSRPRTYDLAARAGRERPAPASRTRRQPLAPAPMPGSRCASWDIVLTGAAAFVHGRRRDVDARSALDLSR